MLTGPGYGPKQLAPRKVIADKFQIPDAVGWRNFRGLALVQGPRPENFIP